MFEITDKNMIFRIQNFISRLWFPGSRIKVVFEAK